MKDKPQPNSVEARTEALLVAVRDRRPSLSAVLDRYGPLSIADYVQTFNNEAEPIDPRSDVIDSACDHTARLLGDETAEKLRERLASKPRVLTANHHGPDLLNITVQGNIITALSETDSVMPVFAFGDVPLNNITYARGLVLPNGSKINIFPDRLKNSLVSVTEPFTAEMVHKAQQRLGKLADSDGLDGEVLATVSEILQSDYLDPTVLEQRSLSDQSVILNSKIWKRIIPREAGDEMPEMVYLEMEAIVSDVLSKDLNNPDSFMHQVLFNPDLRAAVLHNLDGKYGCWDIEALAKLNTGDASGDERRELMSGAGTHFFWGIDAKGRRIPLSLEADEEKAILTGIDDSGNTFNIPFTEESLTEGLESKKILPSLFTSFATVSLARGFRCYGGFMQTDYLTEMNDGLVAATLENNMKNTAQKLARIETQNYSTGMTTIVKIDRTDNTIHPAGAIDIIANGGLTAQDIASIRCITVKEANLVGLPDMYPIIYRNGERDEELQTLTTKEIAINLGSKLVII